MSRKYWFACLLAACLLLAPLSAHAQSADAYFVQGMDYFNAGKLDEAIAAYKQVAALTPQDADIHFALGLAYEKQGNLDDAADAFMAASLYAPKDAGPLFLLGNIFEKQGKTDQAVAVFKQSAKIFTEQNAPKNAITAYHRALAISPNDPALHYDMGLILKAQHDYPAAIVQFRLTDELDGGQFGKEQIEACEQALAAPQP